MEDERQAETEDDVEVVDHRTGAAQPTHEADGPAAEEPAPEAEGPGIPEELLDLMMPPTVDVAARQAVAWFARLAWENLGLVPSARTGKVEVSITEAGRAVDAADFLVKLLSPHMSPEHRRDLDTLIADLKVNFVQKQRG